MYLNDNTHENRFGGHRAFDDREGMRFGDPCPRGDRRGRHGGFGPDGRGEFGAKDGPAPFDHRGFAPDAGRGGFDGGHGPRAFGPRGGHGDFGGPFGPGFPPHGGMPPRGVPPFGGHGMPPRRLNLEFLRRRVDEADLSELIDMAGRMLHGRPQGGPARGQALILSILAGREALSQRQLQQMLGIQPGSLSELISKLEAKGYLTREKAEDRRGNLLRITDAGREAIPRTQDAPEDDLFSPLTADQQDALAAMLRALLNGWIGQLTSEAEPDLGVQV